MQQHILLVCLLICLLSSCEVQSTPSNHIPSASPDIPATAESDTSSYQSPEVSTCSLEDLGEYIPVELLPKSYDLLGFCGQLIFFAADSEYYVYHMDSKQLDCIEPTDNKIPIVSSGSNLTLYDSALVETWLRTEKDSNNVWRDILYIDSVKRKVSVIDSIPQTPDDGPLVYLHKLNADTFLSSEINASDSKIKLYNIREKTVITLLQYDREQTHRTIVNACVSNGIIFVIIYQENSDVPYRMEAYDQSGNLLQQVDMSAARSLLSNSSPLWVHNINGYIILSNWNLEQGIFHIENNALVEVSTPAQKIKVAPNLENYSSCPDAKYIFFFDKTALGKTATPNLLYILDTDTEAIRAVHITGQGDNKELNYHISIDEQHNILITCYDEVYLRYTHYYVPASTAEPIFFSS